MSMMTCRWYPSIYKMTLLQRVLLPPVIWDTVLHWRNCGRMRSDTKMLTFQTYNLFSVEYNTMCTRKQRAVTFLWERAWPKVNGTASRAKPISPKLV